MEKYKIDFCNGSITITAAFANAMQSPQSEEYKLIAALHRDFPALRIVRKSHASPRKYENKQGEIFTCNPFKHLTFKSMETFLSALPQKEELMKAYSFLKDSAGAGQMNAYAVVRRWFTAQFPNYRKNPLFYMTNNVALLETEPFLKSDEKRLAS